MGTFSVWHMMFTALPMALILIIPAWVVATKTGRHGAISLLHFIPFLGGIVYLAILAFGQWPATDGED